MLIFLITIWILIFILSSKAFDDLIEYQYENYKDEWLASRKPRGMFFNPRGSSYLSFCIESMFTYRNKPDWLKGDRNAENLYKKITFWKTIVKWYVIAFIPLVIIATSI